MLNEKNIQACFQYNASTGDWVFEKVEGTLLIDVDSPRVRGQVGSDKIAIDLGYSVDGKVNDWKFTIDGIGMLAIKTVAMRSDLIRLPIEKNECAIVTNDPNFRTILWLNSENNGNGKENEKKLNYSFTTLNSGLGSWQFNEVAKKLNTYNPEGLDNRITDTENRVTIAEGKLNTAETNITALQTGLSEEITARETADTEEANTREKEDNALNTRLVTIEEHTKGFTRNTTEAKTMFTDSIIGTNDLLITGEARFAGPLSVANGQTDVQDFKVNGVVNGELKDSQGFRWEKVRRGSIEDNTNFTNLKVKLNSNRAATITGIYTEYNPASVKSLDKFIVARPNPYAVTNLKTIQFINKDINFKFLASGIKNTDKNFNIIYRNINNVEEYLNGITFDVLIECEIDINNSSIIWE